MALNPTVGVLLPHRIFFARLAAGGAKERAVRVAGEIRSSDVFVERPLQIIVAGNRILLAAFLM